MTRDPRGLLHRLAGGESGTDVDEEVDSHRKDPVPQSAAQLVEVPSRSLRVEGHGVPSVLNLVVPLLQFTLLVLLVMLLHEWSHLMWPRVVTRLLLQVVV